jgi:deoxyribodipyrimidine photo-lyase
MFAATRAEALARLQDFIPASGKYSRERNHVFPYRHENVSRLSPAIRHRLLTEEEAAAAPLARYAPSTVEKFTQEIYWRRYWKSWLSLRPQVWDDYTTELAALESDLSSKTKERLQQVCAGDSGLAIMDLFTRELTETGYLHNHARMWWAGWWIHLEGLPWQLGADFFYRNLLDADPASNTLSWCWVAGLQTAGKTYLPRRSNLEKYLPAALLAEHHQGLELLENPQPRKIAESVAKPPLSRTQLKQSEPDSTVESLLLIHEEDLSPETSPITQFQISDIWVVANRDSWQERKDSSHKQQWLERALQDTLARTQQAFPKARVRENVSTLNAQLAREAGQFEQVLSLRPEVGPLASTFDHLREELPELDTRWHWLDREEDVALRTLATAGFFGFWKKLQTKNLLPQKSQATPHA